MGGGEFVGEVGGVLEPGGEEGEGGELGGEGGGGEEEGEQTFDKISCFEHFQQVQPAVVPQILLLPLAPQPKQPNHHRIDPEIPNIINRTAIVGENERFLGEKSSF